MHLAGQQKKQPTKSQLLGWLNEVLQPNPPILKIEQLGTGVAYIQLLLHFNPNITGNNGNSTHSALPGTTVGNSWIRYNKKPHNEYEYHYNLKMLATLFQKLGIEKSIEIEKLGKLKMQDNLALLQWFYSYFHSKSNNNNNTKNENSNLNIQEQQKKGDQNFIAQIGDRNKKVKIKAPLKLPNLSSSAMQSNKMQIQQVEQAQLKIISSNNHKGNSNWADDEANFQNCEGSLSQNSADYYIQQIENVLHHNTNQHANNQAKLLKIMKILNIKKAVNNNSKNEKPKRTQINSDYLLNQATPTKNIQQNKDVGADLVGQNNYIEGGMVSYQQNSKGIPYVKCRRLQQKYEQFIKTNMLKRPQSSYQNKNPFMAPNSHPCKNHSIQNKSSLEKQKRQTVGWHNLNRQQIHQSTEAYGKVNGIETENNNKQHYKSLTKLKPNGNREQEIGDRNSVRLTQNSNLLQSQCKSARSQTDLLI